jgi:hypothetical protein
MYHLLAPLSNVRVTRTAVLSGVVVVYEKKGYFFLEGGNIFFTGSTVCEVKEANCKL